MTVVIHEDLEQGTEAWFKVRLGLPTASNFSAILAKGEGKTRRSYMCKLAAEIVTGEPGEAFSTGAMERGKIMEADARALYALLSDAPLRQVGFISNGPKGCSPDSLIGDEGGLEIKTERADRLVETLLKGQVPTEHKAQIQGNLWVSERRWWDVLIFWPGMPPLIRRVTRDEPYIDNLAAEVGRFNSELADLVEKVRRCA